MKNIHKSIYFSKIRIDQDLQGLVTFINKAFTEIFENSVSFCKTLICEKLNGALTFDDFIWFDITNSWKIEQKTELLIKEDLGTPWEYLFRAFKLSRIFI